MFGEERDDVCRRKGRETGLMGWRALEGWRRVRGVGGVEVDR